MSKELSNLFFFFFLQVVSGISHQKYLRSVVLMKSSTLVFGFCFAGGLTRYFGGSLCSTIPYYHINAHGLLNFWPLHFIGMLL